MRAVSHFCRVTSHGNTSLEKGKMEPPRQLSLGIKPTLNSSSLMLSLQRQHGVMGGNMGFNSTDQR